MKSTTQSKRKARIDGIKNLDGSRKRLRAVIMIVVMKNSQKKRLS